jgi:hypothetical protein
MDARKWPNSTSLYTRSKACNPVTQCKSSYKITATTGKSYCQYCYPEIYFCHPKTLLIPQDVQITPLLSNHQFHNITYPTVALSAFVHNFVFVGCHLNISKVQRKEHSCYQYELLSTRKLKKN